MTGFTTKGEEEESVLNTIKSWNRPTIEAVAATAGATCKYLLLSGLATFRRWYSSACIAILRLSCSPPSSSSRKILVLRMMSCTVIDLLEGLAAA